MEGKYPTLGKYVLVHISYLICNFSPKPTRNSLPLIRRFTARDHSLHSSLISDKKQNTTMICCSFWGY
uniref:Uncharacterized protein n=1 Tax=Helianthus annuus TaxID=4232 RepID=A0A251VQD8_HELAN